LLWIPGREELAHPGMTVYDARTENNRKKRRWPTDLRKGLTSYGDAGFSLFLRKAFIKAMGYSDDALNRPIVGITNTYSDYNPCHGNVPQIIEAVKRGVMLAARCRWCFRPSRSPKALRIRPRCICAT
jgi:dihydroxyacid dehydratase/phosphogluconate dehydratase